MGLRLLALENLCRNFIKLDEDKMLNKVLSVSSLQQDILDLNREDQLYDKGITSDNKELGEYSNATIQGTSNFEGKISKGQPYSHITLKDTGAFYESFKFRNTNDGIIISANTMKPDVDLMTYGNILGLTNQNKSVVAQWIKAPFIKEMRSAIWK